MNFGNRFQKKITGMLAPGIPLRTYQRFLRRNPIGFFYHIVSDKDLPHIRHLYPYKTAAAFEQDLLYLKKHYTLLGYRELAAAMLQNQTLPSNAAFISFDDGFRECYTVARPLLLKHQVPCMFFLVSDFVDNQNLYYRAKISLCIDYVNNSDPERQGASLKQVNQAMGLSLQDAAAFSEWLKAHQQSDEPLVDRVCELLGVDYRVFLREHTPFLTSEEIRQMQKDGFVFGAHSRRHQKLKFLPPEQQVEEIIESCRRVKSLTGEDQVPFAFPFSGDGVDRSMLQRLREQHPEIGLFFDTKKLKQDQPFVLHRIWVDKPIPGVAADQNIAFYLHDAYQRAFSGR